MRSERVKNVSLFIITNVSLAASLISVDACLVNISCPHNVQNQPHGGYAPAIGCDGIVLYDDDDRGTYSLSLECSIAHWIEYSPLFAVASVTDAPMASPINLPILARAPKHSPPVRGDC